MSRRAHLLWRCYALVYDTLWDNALTAAVAEGVVSELSPRWVVDEVGAGTGLITQRLHARGYDVRAHEPNASMRARLARRLPEVAADDLPIEALPPIGAPRTVVAVNVVHLTPDPVAAIRHMRKRAGANGQVVVVTPDPAASVTRVARAQRRAGASVFRAMAFVAVHVALAPLVTLAGAAPRARALASIIELALAPVRLNNTSWLLLFDGEASADAVSGPGSTAPAHGQPPAGRGREGRARREVPST